MATDDRLIIFDGVCNLCNGFVKFVIKHDPLSKFKFIAFQQIMDRNLASEYGLSEVAPETVILFTGGEKYFKSTAVLKIIRELKFPFRYFYFLICVPRFIRDYVYDLVANSRYRIFGKRDSCMVPDPELNERFVK